MTQRRDETNGAPPDLRGRVAIVTGAGRGIGRAIAANLARRGAAVVVNDTGGAFSGDPEDAGVAAAVAARIAAEGGTAIPNVDSVDSMEGAERIAATALDQFGRIDVLVDNAGITRQNMLWDMTEVDFDRVVAVHLKGTFACMKAVIPHMIGQRSGSIVNMSSGVGVVGSVGTANYLAAKAGIIGLSFGAAMELGPYGVRVNVLFPAGFSRLHTKEEPWRDRYPVTDRPFMPEEDYPPDAIAPLVAFLASDAGRDVNGQLFSVGGDSVGRFGSWDVVHEVRTADGRPWDDRSFTAALPHILQGIANPSPPQSGDIVWPWIRPNALPAAHDPSRRPPPSSKEVRA